MKKGEEEKKTTKKVEKRNKNIQHIYIHREKEKIYLIFGFSVNSLSFFSLLTLLRGIQIFVKCHAKPSHIFFLAQKILNNPHELFQLEKKVGKSTRFHFIIVTIIIYLVLIMFHRPLLKLRQQKMQQMQPHPNLLCWYSSSSSSVKRVFFSPCVVQDVPKERRSCQ